MDAILLHKNIVFVIEFKCGANKYNGDAYDQVYDYALDLQNFHKESHNKLIAPILLATKALEVANKIVDNNRVIDPLRCNKSNLRDCIREITELYSEPDFDYCEWEKSQYLPTPTIVEAARALYSGHHVEDITRSDAGTKNIELTLQEINRIIEYSKQNERKSICFVTGVPGAGKTLVGLDVAIQYSHAEKGEHAVFLSGNFPLVKVLQEALARDKVEQAKLQGNKIYKGDALRATSAFIQIIHKYRDSFVGNADLPPERVAIFDEAQRAWEREAIGNFMSRKKGVNDFTFSEPEFLIDTMDRHRDWAVILCLVGGGQEINTGEAGLPEWFYALQKSFNHWDVYVTSALADAEYLRGASWAELTRGLNICHREYLHLSSSVRSFRTPKLSAFVKALLDIDKASARTCLAEFREKYPIVLTRDLNKAKDWMKAQAKGSARYGLLASSGALRLKPEGIFVKNNVAVADWFLNSKRDVRSSYALEDVVSEFDIQGLELDYTLVAWDGDFRFDGRSWTYNRFHGAKWQKINKETDKLYLKNAYRVLLTRARQGMAIFIPNGSDEDETRRRDYYDETFNYLASIGIEVI